MAAAPVDGPSSKRLRLAGDELAAVNAIVAPYATSPILVQQLTSLGMYTLGVLQFQLIPKLLVDIEAGKYHDLISHVNLASTFNFTYVPLDKLLVPIVGRGVPKQVAATRATAQLEDFAFAVGHPQWQNTYTRLPLSITDILTDIRHEIITKEMDFAEQRGREAIAAEAHDALVSDLYPEVRGFLGYRGRQQQQPIRRASRQSSALPRGRPIF